MSKNFQMCELNVGYSANEWKLIAAPLRFVDYPKINSPPKHTTLPKTNRIANKWFFVIEPTIHNLSSAFFCRRPRKCSNFPLWQSSNDLSCQSVSACLSVSSVGAKKSTLFLKKNTLENKSKMLRMYQPEEWERKKIQKQNFINFVKLTDKSM